ncbi:MAG TPA: hypothetical protein DEA43_04260 [Candidatus Moranbacteria bacterium]|nr:hypothetical protein [Candidatus Moranbacteria bacterium]HBT46067.1 hypothetical protein [Candidatus Moranbacteria bacterium]
MSEKNKHENEKTFDPVAFEAFVRTWVKVSLKEVLNLKTVPPSFDVLKKVMGRGIFDVLKVEDGNSLKKCLCEKDPHTEDCLSWHHLSVKILDSEGNNRWVHSLWLNPVEVLPIEKVSIETPAETEKTSVIENISAGVAEVKVSESTSVTIKNPEIIFPKAVQENVKKNYCWVSFSQSAELKIVDIEEVCNPEFLFDEDAQEWIFYELTGKVGEIVPLDSKDYLNGFEAVIEGNRNILLSVIVSSIEISKKRLKQAIIEGIEKI